MNILITGSNGYLGSCLIEKLLEYKKLNQIQFNKLYLYDNLMYNQLSLLDKMHYPEIEFIKADVLDFNTLKAYINVCDVIIPLAAIVGAPACDNNKELAVKVNYDHIKFICSFKNKKVIIPTTNSMYGSSTELITEESPINPLSLYAKTKIEAEKEVLGNGGISLRLATLFGLSQKMRIDLLVNSFTLKAIEDSYLVLFEKHFMRNYLHIQDAAEAFIHFIINFEQYNTNIYNVGLSNANLSKLQLAEKIKEYIPDLTIKEEEFRKDEDQRNYIISNSKIESTGWRATKSIDFGIKELIKGYQIIINNRNKGFTNL